MLDNNHFQIQYYIGNDSNEFSLRFKKETTSTETLGVVAGKFCGISWKNKVLHFEEESWKEIINWLCFKVDH